ncbi:type I restriction enzyme S subunit [Mesorhizobium sp. USDA 4775]
MKASPKGWAEDTLGGLGEWRGGGTPNKSNSSFWTNGDIPWVSPKDMKQTFIDGAEDRITADAVRESATQLISEGSVLIVTRSGILRHTLPVGITTRKVAINQDLKALTPFPAVDPVFAGYQIRSLGRTILSTCAKSGTTVDSIDFERLKGVTFAVPPLHEQRRIVAKIDSLAGKSRRARDHLDHIPRLVEKYKQAVLAAAFRGDLTVGARGKHASSGWTKTTLAEVCDRRRPITYGVIKLGSEVPGGVPCLRTSNVRWLSIEVQGIKSISKVLSDEYHRTILSGGEVLVNVRGTLGGVAVVPSTMSGWNVSREVAVAAVDARHVLAEYAAYWIAATSSQRWLSGVEKGVAYTGINIEDLRKLPVAYPNRDEQREIVRRIETAFNWIDRLASEATSARRLIDHLDQSVLAKAFQGELVPQDPTDEPADVLLQRIRAGRDRAQKTRRGRRGRHPA